MAAFDCRLTRVVLTYLVKRVAGVPPLGGQRLYEQKHPHYDHLTLTEKAIAGVLEIDGVTYLEVAETYSQWPGERKE